MRIMLGISLAGILATAVPLAKAGDLAHGRDCATAVSISPNSTTQAALSDADDLAVFRVVLDQRGVIDVWTDPGSFTVWGTDLLDSACTPVPTVGGGISMITGKY